MEKSIEEKNIVIAKWLGAEHINDAPIDYPNGYYMWKEGVDKHISEIDLPLEAKNLKFHSDLNWQWLCLEKIAGIEECTISHLFLESYFWQCHSKQDLFETIYNYISNK